MGHLLMENRPVSCADIPSGDRPQADGLIVVGRVSAASGTAERDEAQAMVAAIPGQHRVTVGGDKNFDTKGFVDALQELNATPHVAQNTSNRRSAIDRRTIDRSAVDPIAQRTGPQERAGRAPSGLRGEPAHPQADRGVTALLSRGWIKEIALQRRARHRGKERVGWQFTLAAVAYNLIRLPKLLPA
jgi:hypothetical protein